MSWLARSLANSLKIKDDDDDGEENKENNISDRSRGSSHRATEENEEHRHSIGSSLDNQGRGVKEDLSELTKTLTRQLWGVASFLAPPPPSEPSPPPSPPPPPRPNQIHSPNPSVSDWDRWESSDQSVSDAEISDPTGISGVRSDFAEIGGRFRSGISKLSRNRAVSEISKIASNFLPFGSEQDSLEKYPIGDAVGVTDEVLAFARNIAMHPETWMDFPMAEDEELDDFDMSDTQQEHALAVERLAPRLAALRIELCPGHMSEGCFWKIYFVLLHSRLNKHDAELLSTPQIVKARSMWMQELQKRTKPEADWSGSGTSYSKEILNSVQEECLSASSTVPLKTFVFDPATSTAVTDFETEKHPVTSSSTEMQIIDKNVVEEGPVIQVKNKNLLTCGASSSSKVLDQKHDDDGDDWLEEENSEIGGYRGTTIPLGNEEDVSFSDLEEDDDDGTVPTSSKTTPKGFDSSAKDSPGWVQLSRSSANSGKDGHQSIGSEQRHGNNPETKESNDWLNVDDIDVV